MALITCPECGKNFSDRAPACPECGFPTSELVHHNKNDGQIIIANNAFEDWRFDEAYQLFTQMYAQEQNNPHICIRLALSTIAKDTFINGIPNSTKRLFIDGLELSMGACKDVEELTRTFVKHISDVKNVTKAINEAMEKNMFDAVDQMSYTRSGGAMVVDALFTPVNAAHRNLYEDERARESNRKIMDNATINNAIIEENLKKFNSFVLKAVSEVIKVKLDSENELSKTLYDLVSNPDDLKIYSDIINKTDIYGLCFGPEKTILHFDNNSSYMLINDKVHVGGFAAPKGELTLTNYKVVYNENKGKRSFQKTLDDLIQVKAGGLLTGTSNGISLIFPNNIRVTIIPNTPSEKNNYLEMIKKILKV